MRTLLTCMFVLLAMPTAVSADVAAAKTLVARQIRERLDAYGRGDARAWSAFVDDDCVCAADSKSDIVRTIATRPATVKNWYGDILDLKNSTRLRNGVPRLTSDVQGTGYSSPPPTIRFRRIPKPSRYRPRRCSNTPENTNTRPAPSTWSQWRTAGYSCSRMRTPKSSCSPKPRLRSSRKAKNGDLSSQPTPMAQSHQ